MLDELVRLIAEKGNLDYDTMRLPILIGLKAGLVAGVFLPLISLIAMFFIWWERKVAGHIQGRLGPMHVGLWHGWAQSLADGIKLIMKEDLMPRGADAFMFKLAPYLAFAPVFAAFLAIPFGPQFVYEAGLNIGVLYLLAVLSVEVMGVILAGWGSNSKWSIYGAMREACQMVSYEIPLGLSIICGVLVAGTLDMVELGYLQGGGLHKWFIFHNPFIFIAFVLYFIASLAANKRAPFDLPESESELVAGFHTEYSGFRWSLFFFAEYGAMFVVGCIQAILFLGAWNSPLGAWDPVHLALGYNPQHAGYSFFSGAVESAGGFAQTAAAMGFTGKMEESVGKMMALNFYGAFWVIIKATVIIYVQMWLRWTLPRIRIDQVLNACIKVLLPASLITFVGTAGWILLVRQPAAPIINGVRVARAGHLLSSTPFVQLATEIVLALVGVGIIGFCLGVIAWAFLSRSKHPPKSFFPDIMPVGNQIAFNPGKPAKAEAAEGEAAAEPA